MDFAPVRGDLLARTDPHPLVLLDIIEETLQGAEAPRPAKQAAVHTDGHHLRRIFPSSYSTSKLSFR
jgi:hypothetical protein